MDAESAANFPTDDQDLAEFTAIISDAISHRYLDGEQYWPDTWQMLRDCMVLAGPVRLMQTDPEYAQLAIALLAYGYDQGYDTWEYGPSRDETPWCDA